MGPWVVEQNGVQPPENIAGNGKTCWACGTYAQVVTRYTIIVHIIIVCSIVSLSNVALLQRSLANDFELPLGQVKAVRSVPGSAWTTR